MTVPDFDIEEKREAGVVRLVLSGELDVASAPLLQGRLDELRAEPADVRLDLSKLEFMDSTGVHLLIGALQNSRVDGWRLEVAPDVAPAVMRVLQLVHLDRFVLGDPDS
jgi:anti-sigma B factor antagonist